MNDDEKIQDFLNSAEEVLLVVTNDDSKERRKDKQIIEMLNKLLEEE